MYVTDSDVLYSVSIKNAKMKNARYLKHISKRERKNKEKRKKKKKIIEKKKDVEKIKTKRTLQCFDNCCIVIVFNFKY